MKWESNHREHSGKGESLGDQSHTALEELQPQSPKEKQEEELKGQYGKGWLKCGTINGSLRTKPQN